VPRRIILSEAAEPEKLILMQVNKNPHKAESCLITSSKVFSVMDRIFFLMTEKN